MKNQWKKKKRLKPLRSSKANHSRTGSGLAAGGKGMGADRDMRDIIELMLMDIVDQGGTVSLSMDDGVLRVSAEAGDGLHGGTSGKEGPR